jgi:hypothetical protein
MDKCTSCDKKEQYTKTENEETKEDFICAACIGVGFAAAGIGATAAGAKMSKKKYKTGKQITFWVGISSLIIAILLFIWAAIPVSWGGCRSCKV